jgi:hypothetical protein
MYIHFVHGKCACRCKETDCHYIGMNDGTHNRMTLHCSLCSCVCSLQNVMLAISLLFLHESLFLRMFIDCLCGYDYLFLHFLFDFATTAPFASQLFLFSCWLLSDLWFFDSCFPLLSLRLRDNEYETVLLKANEFQNVRWSDDFHTLFSHEHQNFVCGDIECYISLIRMKW